MQPLYPDPVMAEELLDPRHPETGQTILMGDRHHMAAAPGARLVNLGESAGATLSLPSALLRSRHLEILGYTNMGLTLAEQRAGLEALLDHAGAGRLHLDHDVMLLEQLSQAWERQAGSTHRKLVIQVA